MAALVELARDEILGIGLHGKELRQPDARCPKRRTESITWPMPQTRLDLRVTVRRIHQIEWLTNHGTCALEHKCPGGSIFEYNRPKELWLLKLMAARLPLRLNSPWKMYLNSKKSLLENESSSNLPWSKKGDQEAPSRQAQQLRDF